MKKMIVISIVVVLLLILGLGIYYFISKEIPDNVKFKEEYEAINGEKINGKVALTMDIPEENNVKYASFDEIMDVLESGTGVIYFGFPECPWCRNAVPVLIDAVNKMEVDTIYYFNAYEMRDQKELKNGEIITTKEGTKEYYKLVEALDEVLEPYEGLEDDSIKRLYFPTAVFVMGGKIVDAHISTVESQEDPYKGLTEDEEEELFNIYTNAIEKIYGVCDESC